MAGVDEVAADAAVEAVDLGGRLAGRLVVAPQHVAVRDRRRWCRCRGRRAARCGRGRCGASSGRLWSCLFISRTPSIPGQPSWLVLAEAAAAGARSAHGGGQREQGKAHGGMGAPERGRAGSLWWRRTARERTCGRVAHEANQRDSARRTSGVRRLDAVLDLGRATDPRGPLLRPRLPPARRRPSRRGGRTGKRPTPTASRRRRTAGQRCAVQDAVVDELVRVASARLAARTCRAGRTPRGRVRAIAERLVTTEAYRRRGWRAAHRARALAARLTGDVTGAADARPRADRRRAARAGAQAAGAGRWSPTRSPTRRRS